MSIDSIQTDQVGSQGNELLLCSAFAHIMEEGSPDADQKRVWKQIRDRTGIYGALHYRVLVPREHVISQSQNTILQAVQELRHAFERGGAKSVADNVALSLAWYTKAPKSLDQFEVGDGETALLVRLLLEQFVPPTFQELENAAKEFDDLEDVVNEAFTSRVRR